MAQRSSTATEDVVRGVSDPAQAGDMAVMVVADTAKFTLENEAPGVLGYLTAKIFFCLLPMQLWG